MGIGGDEVLQAENVRHSPLEDVVDETEAPLVGLGIPEVDVPGDNVEK